MTGRFVPLSAKAARKGENPCVRLRAGPAVFRVVTLSMPGICLIASLMGKAVGLCTYCATGAQTQRVLHGSRNGKYYGGAAFAF